MTRAEKRRNLYTSSSKYRNWPRLGLGAVGLRSLGLAGCGAGLCKRNSVLNILGPRIGVNQLLMAQEELDLCHLDAFIGLRICQNCGRGRTALRKLPQRS